MSAGAEPPRVDDRFRPGEGVPTAVHRIADELVSHASHQLTVVVGDDPATAVHETRKDCKQLRALARLVRPAVPPSAYRALDAAIRTTAGELSALRDATATAAALGALAASLEADEPAAAASLDPVVTAVAARAREVEATLTGAHPRVVAARGRLATVAHRLDDLRVGDDGWQAIAPGLRRVYRAGRDGHRSAAHHGDAHAFHEWRKQAKYGWYHVRFLGAAAPSILDPLASAFHDLSGLLGDAHDLAVLADLVRQEESVETRRAIAACEAIESRRRSLELQALGLGDQLYAEPPRRYADRLGRYWAAWRRTGSSRIGTASA